MSVLFADRDTYDAFLKMEPDAEIVEADGGNVHVRVRSFQGVPVIPPYHEWAALPELVEVARSGGTIFGWRIEVTPTGWFAHPPLDRITPPPGVAKLRWNGKPDSFGELLKMMWGVEPKVDGPV